MLYRMPECASQYKIGFFNQYQFEGQVSSPSIKNVETYNFLLILSFVTHLWQEQSSRWWNLNLTYMRPGIDVDLNKTLCGLDGEVKHKNFLEHDSL